MAETKYFNISIDYEDLHRYALVIGSRCSLDPDENSAFEKAIPRFIDLFQAHNIHATFFITGEEVFKKPINRTLIRRLHDAGHEIANHTYHHYFNFSHLPYQTKQQEILSCQRVLEDITGERIIGFRAPCYDVDDATIELLREHGYLYDSSIYPIYFRGLQRLGYFCWGLIRLKKFGVWRKTGRFKHAFVPVRPYWIECKNGGRKLLQIPIQTAGMLRLPLFSTLVFQLGYRYFQWQYPRIGETELLTFALHSIDLIGYEEDSVASHYKDLRVHPSMKMENKKKIETLTKIFKVFQGDRQSITLRRFAETKASSLVFR